MDVEITKSNGHSIRLSDFGIVKDFVVESISLDEIKETGEGMHGFIDYGAFYRSRKITVPMKFKSGSLHGFSLVRDELYKAMTDIEPVYIREMRRPERLQYDFVSFGEKPRWSDNTDNRYVGGKRFKVRMISTMSPEQIVTDGEVTLEFETVESPFAESIGTSMDLHRDGLDPSSEIWGAGMNLDAREYKYSEILTNSNLGLPDPHTISVYNPSDVDVTPFEHDLKITLTGMYGIGSSNAMIQLTNLTNGSRFRAYGPIQNNQTLLYDGPTVTLDGAQYLGNTLRNFIYLSPGNNNIRIYHADRANVEFDFRFYYK